MMICCECAREMQCDLNGVGADYGDGHVYAGDRYVCPAYRFYLWCAPKGVFAFGLPENGERVWSSVISVAPQRPFPGEN